MAIGRFVIVLGLALSLSLAAACLYAFHHPDDDPTIVGKHIDFASPNGNWIATLEEVDNGLGFGQGMPCLLRQPPLLEDSCVACDSNTHLSQQRRRKLPSGRTRNVACSGAQGDIAGSIVMPNALPACQIPIAVGR